MISTLFILLLSVFHPFYISVTNIDYNKQDKRLEISCRIFFDDLEDALAKQYGERLSLLKPANRSVVDQYLTDYLNKNLSIEVNGKVKSISYVGYEIEEDAAWCYLQIGAIEEIDDLVVHNSILYPSHKQQSNILHVSANGQRKSLKLDYPKSKASFRF